MQDANISLSRLIEAAKRIKMSDEERELQKRDFAYGNTKIENGSVTREMIERAADRRLKNQAK